MTIPFENPPNKFAASFVPPDGCKRVVIYYNDKEGITRIVPKGEDIYTCYNPQPAKDV